MSARAERFAALEALLAERIVILDGAMGTMVQGYQLEEADYRGEQFRDWPSDLKGNHDLLSLTRPDVVREIHGAFFDAGADIVETNSFNSTAPALADYGLEDRVRELNFAASRVAREVADDYTARTGQPRFVAGVLGPTNRTASISPDVNDPGMRNISFDELVVTYGEAARALIDGGADFILVETVFDTLNAKAALYAIDVLASEELGEAVPVMISGTITDASGRTLSGQTTEAFWNSVRHARPFLIGAELRPGRRGDLRPYLRRTVTGGGHTQVSVHPNAGLPNEFGGYDDTPELHGRRARRLCRREGLLNMVGGCCGTTPEHIRAIATRRQPASPPRVGAEISRRPCGSAGLEPMNIGRDSLFVNVGERTNVAGSAKFKRLIIDDDYEAALQVARQQVENGAQIIDVNMDEGMLDSVAAMDRFLKLIAGRAGYRACRRWSIRRAGKSSRPG